MAMIKYEEIFKPKMSIMGYILSPYCDKIEQNIATSRAINKAV